MEGVPKLTLPDIGEKRGQALQTDQTPNPISRSCEHEGEKNLGESWWQMIKTTQGCGCSNCQFTLNWSRLGIAGLISCLYVPYIGGFQSNPALYIEQLEVGSPWAPERNEGYVAGRSSSQFNLTELILLSGVPSHLLNPPSSSLHSSLSL